MLDYKSAGVDLDTYEQTIAGIGPLLKRTFSPRVMDWPNGFAGLFRLNDRINLLARSYRDPVLVAGSDGVGTKLMLAFATGRHRTVGIDLVAMSVNDVLCCGAEPLFFLDYIAMAKDDPAQTHAVVGGISDGCVEAECALLGGETAILPGFYQPGHYDLAGFCVGVVERKMILNGSDIRPGDTIIGMASSGLHSNGYSLARKIAFEAAGLKPEDHVPELGRSIADELLEPTRIYARALKLIYKHYQVKRVVHGIAHITGGGMVENPPRILPDGCGMRIKRCWDVPPIFQWLQKMGNVRQEEMDRVFNMGLGMTLVVAPYYAESIVRTIREKAGINAWIIGEVVPSAEKTVELI